MCVCVCVCVLLIISPMFFVLHPSTSKVYWETPPFSLIVSLRLLGGDTSKTSSNLQKGGSSSSLSRCRCSPVSVRLLAMACHKMPRPAESVEDSDPTSASVRSVATSSAKNRACLANHAGKNINLLKITKLNLKNIILIYCRCPQVFSYIY